MKFSMYLEMADFINKKSGIKFKEKDNEFDSDEAESECRKKAENDVSLAHHYHNNDVYDRHQDDHNFTPEDDYPDKPDSDDFESEEEYKKELKTWEAECQNIYNDYLMDWEEEQEDKRKKAEEEYDEELESSIQDCLKQKEKEHDEEKEISHEYNFIIDGKKYLIEFVLSKETIFLGKHIDNCYILNFSDEKGYTNSGEVGNKAAEVYSELLSAVHQFLQDVKVTALEFHPYTYAMISLYQRFYTQFLSKEFQRVKLDLYMRKEELKKFMATHEYEVNHEITKTGIEVQKHIKDAKEEKIKERENKKFVNEYFGKILFCKKTNTFVSVCKLHIGQKESTIFVVTPEGQVWGVNYTEFDLSKQPNKFDIHDIQEKTRACLKLSIDERKKVMAKLMEYPPFNS